MLLKSCWSKKYLDWNWNDPRLEYLPCRPDGLDRNLKFLKCVDYIAGVGHRGLVLPCVFDDCEICAPRKK